MVQFARLLRRLCAIATALSCALLAQSSDRDEAFRSDLQYLASELPGRHVNPFHQISAANFYTAVSELDADIPKLGDTEIMVRMAEIVASIGESHTNLALPQGRTSFRWFPITFFGFEDGWRVTAARTDLAQILGCRIVRIGDTPIEDVYRKVAPTIAHENDAWLKQQFPSYAIYADILKTVGIIGTLDSASWTFETLSGQQFSLEIPSIPQGSVSGVGLPDNQGFIALYRQNTASAYWYTYIESTRTLYFAYNQCTDVPSRPFSAFAQELFGVLDANPVDRLIIDLRNNPGGNSAVLDPFLNGIKARQSRFATVTRVIAIIGRRTASSGLLNAISIKGQPYSVLIGEPTGGKPGSYGEVQSFKLPYSGANVNYSTKFFPSTITTDSLMPDRNVRIYSRDFFARQDPFLAAAMADDTIDSPMSGGAPLVNGATFRPGPVAPGSLASLFVPLPAGATSSGVEVRFAGQPARLNLVTPGQINLQVPYGLAPGTATLQVLRDGVESFADTVQIAAAAPGLFLADMARGDQPGAILNQDSQPNTASVRARRGDIIQIFATGAGPVDQLPRVFVGADAAEVVYSGMSAEFAGLWQINVRLPNVPSIAKQVPMFVIAGGSAVSNGVTLWVED